MITTHLDLHGFRGTLCIKIGVDIGNGFVYHKLSHTISDEPLNNNKSEPYGLGQNLYVGI